MDGPLPDALRNETRLAAVRHPALAEASAQEAFDRLVRLGTRVLRVPVGLVSLVEEDRQVFRGCIGLPEPWASERQTPLSHSFCQHVVGSGEPLVVEDAREHPDLRENLAIRDLEVIAYAGFPLITSEGQVLGSFCVIDTKPRRWSEEELEILRDLTASVMTEIELREAAHAVEQEQRHRLAVLEATDEGIYGIDGAGRCTFLNSAGAAMLGYSPQEALGRNMHTLIHHHHADGSFFEEADCPIYGASKTSEGVRVEDDVLWRKDGSSFPVTYASFPAHDGEEITGAVITFRDITERKRAEQERERLLRELEVERTRLATVFEHAPAFMAVMRGPEHVLELANPAYYEIIGHRDIIGMPIRAALPELEGQGFFTRLDEVYRSGERYVGTESRVQLEIGSAGSVEERFVNFVYQPLTSADGSVTGILVHGVDVTEQVRAREAVEEASRAKSDFLATMSHELRTPLNAMIGYTELLQMGVPEPIGDEARSQVERIRLSAKHLLELIEEILTFSRIEAGRERLDLDWVDLREIADEAYAIIDPLAEKKGLLFRIDVPEEPVVLETDARKLRQILLNVLGNAVKFTERGQVIFQVEGDGDEISLAVADSGVGIAPEHLEKVFEPFWQAETAMHSRVEGTGLGLPVTRRLTELLGGTLQVESTPGVGTTVRLRFARGFESGRLDVDPTPQAAALHPPAPDD